MTMNISEYAVLIYDFQNGNRKPVDFSQEIVLVEAIR